MNLKKELSELLGGMQVEGGNDANVAALGEIFHMDMADLAARTVAAGHDFAVDDDAAAHAGSQSDCHQILMPLYPAGRCGQRTGQDGREGDHERRRGRRGHRRSRPG